MAVKKLSPRSSRDLFPFQIQDTKVIEIGDYVMIDATTGGADVLADTAGDLPIGFVVDWNPPNADTDGDGAVTGDTGVSSPPEAIVDIGGRIEDVVVVGVSGITDMGKLVFGTGPDTFTLTPTANIGALGRVVRHILGTTAAVRFFDMDELS